MNIITIITIASAKIQIFEDICNKKERFPKKSPFILMYVKTLKFRTCSDEQECSLLSAQSLTILVLQRPEPYRPRYPRTS